MLRLIFVFDTASNNLRCNWVIVLFMYLYLSYNTASSNPSCNLYGQMYHLLNMAMLVTTPQAVIQVATESSTTSTSLAIGVTTPQAVIQVATRYMNDQEKNKGVVVTTPQAVIQVATNYPPAPCRNRWCTCYNTASSNPSCNHQRKPRNFTEILQVTTPQAVIQVATLPQVSCQSLPVKRCYNTASSNPSCNGFPEP